MPDVPTVAEMGLPGYEGILWIGLIAPAGTPQPIVDRLAAASAKAVRSPDLAARLTKDGIDPVGNTPAEFGALIARELVQWRDLVKAANIKPECTVSTHGKNRRMQKLTTTADANCQEAQARRAARRLRHPHPPVRAGVSVRVRQPLPGEGRAAGNAFRTCRRRWASAPP